MYMKSSTTVGRISAPQSFTDPAPARKGSQATVQIFWVGSRNNPAFCRMLGDSRCRELAQVT